jgi:hypothetical protein
MRFSLAFKAGSSDWSVRQDTLRNLRPQEECNDAPELEVPAPLDQRLKPVPPKPGKNGVELLTIC